MDDNKTEVGEGQTTERSRLRRTRRLGARVSARAVWRLIAAVVLVGLLGLGGLYLYWRTGQSVRLADLPESESGRVAYAGVFPPVGLPRLVGPRGIAVQDDRVWVAEPDAGRVSIFTLGGQARGSIDLRDAVDDDVYPVDIAVVGDRVFVLDGALARVVSLTSSGGDARTVEAAGEHPTSLVSDGTNLLVADAASHSVLVLDASGRRVGTLAQELEPSLTFVTGMWADDNTVALADSNASRVILLDRKTGAQTGILGEGTSLPRGVARDDRGRTWLADVFGGTVSAFGPDGALLGSLEDEEFLAEGPPPTLERPQDVAWSSSASRLYVTDSAGGRVVVFSLP